MIVTKTWTVSEEVEVPDGYEIVGDSKRIVEKDESYLYCGCVITNCIRSENEYWIVKKTWVPPVSAPKGTRFYVLGKDPRGKDLWYVDVDTRYDIPVEFLYKDFVPPIDVKSITI
jgi:hypothetical protein